MERYELGQLLLRKGIITQQQLEEALAIQRDTKKFLGEILVENGYVSKNILLEALTEQGKANSIQLSKVKGIKPEVVRLIPEAIARRFEVLAISLSDDVLVVAMKDPTDIVAIDTIKRITGKRIKVVRAEEKRFSIRLSVFILKQAILQRQLLPLKDLMNSQRKVLTLTS